MFRFRKFQGLNPRRKVPLTKLPTGLAVSPEQIAKPVVPGSKWVDSSHTEYFRYSIDIPNNAHLILY